MKMNFKFLTLAATALTLGFASCSSDDETDNNGVVPNGAETYAKITLTQSSPGTYALPGGATDGATPGEAFVKDATLYVFKSDQTLEATVSMAVVAGVASKEFMTTTGTHYYLTIVNSSQVTLPTFVAGTAITTVQKSILAAIDAVKFAAITDDSQTNGFFMTTVGAIPSNNLVPNIQGGNANDLPLHVGRATAKFNVEYPAATPVVNGTIDATTVKYMIAGNTQKMYLFPVPVGAAFHTPDYTAYDLITAPLAGVYLPDMATVTSASFTKLADSNNPVYGMENSNAVPTQGNSTLVVVEAQYTPAATLNENDLSPAAGVVNADFWRIQKTDKSFFPTMYSADPSTGSALGTAQTASPGAVLVKYTAGKSYYMLPVQDASKSSPEKYDVIRNNYYAIKITNVTGPGANSPGGVIITPTTPLATDTYMNATIAILPWTVVQQSGGLVGQ